MGGQGHPTPGLTLTPPQNPLHTYTHPNTRFYNLRLVRYEETDGRTDGPMDDRWTKKNKAK